MSADATRGAEELARAEVARAPRPTPPLEVEPLGGADVALRASCVIDHYDDGELFVETLASALSQTRPFDEIVVVDDGSSAPELERVRAACARHARVTLVEKPNGGQLSALQAGIAACTGDVVFFLDADDLYEPDYLERALAVYGEHADCDVLLAGWRRFGAEGGEELACPEPTRLGPAAVLAEARSHAKLVVSPTSSLSMRRATLERFLPLDLEADWRIRADDCLVFGAALAGAVRYHLGEVGVGYRIHASNRWYGREADELAEYRHRLALGRLFDRVHARLGNARPPVALAARELALSSDRSWSRVRAYGRIVLRSDLGLRGKARALFGLARVALEDRVRLPGDPSIPWSDERRQRRARRVFGAVTLLTLVALVSGGVELSVAGANVSMSSPARPLALLAIWGAVLAWREPRLRPGLTGILRAIRGEPGRRLAFGARLILVASLLTSVGAWLAVPEVVELRKRRASRGGLIEHGAHTHLRELVESRASRDGDEPVVLHITEGDARAHLSSYFLYPRTVLVAPELRAWALRSRMLDQPWTDPLFEDPGPMPDVEVSRAFAEARGLELIVVPDDLLGASEQADPELPGGGS